MQNANLTNDGEHGPAKRRLRLKPLACGALFGVVLACAIAMALLFVLGRGSTPLLTEEALRSLSVDILAVPAAKR